MSARGAVDAAQRNPQGPTVEVTPGRALCLMLSTAYRKPPQGAVAVTERWTESHAL